MGGYMLSESGRPEAALRFYRRALDIDGSRVVAHVNSGKLLFDSGRFAEALAAFEAATALAPGDADAWCSRAGALRELGRPEELLEAARRALALRPDFAEAAINLGNALLKLDRMEEALDAYRRASAAAPGLASALCGQALALRNLGRFSEALAAFEAAEALGCREAVAGKGCLMLTLGDFERGWEGYEARWLKGKSLADALGTRYPTWNGPTRPGERVLVLNDHGLGDTIQFFRYLPLMAAAGVETTFVCPPNLRRLLSSKSDVRFVDSPPAGEPFDAQIAISSLPRAFGTRLEFDPGRRALSFGGAGPVRKMGQAHRTRRIQNRRRLAGQSESGGGPRALRAACRLRAARHGRRRQARFASEGIRRGTAGQSPAFHAGRDARGGFRLGARRVRGRRGGDDPARSRRHLRHVDRASRRGAGETGVGGTENRRRMALVDRTRRFPLVPDDAAVPAVPARRLERRVRRHEARAGRIDDAAAARRARFSRRARSAS